MDVLDLDDFLHQMLVPATNEPIPPVPQDDSLQDAELLCISLHALTGQLVPTTLKLEGVINGRDVTVLIDGGSTNNFVLSCLAKHLGLTVQPSSHLRVTTGNGEALDCGGECLQVQIKLGEAFFSVDLLLLPIYGANLVLGVQWLANLGPVLFNYTHLWMEFDY